MTDITADSVKEELDEIMTMVKSGCEREMETAELLRSIHGMLGDIRKSQTIEEARRIAWEIQLDMIVTLRCQINEMEKAE